MTMVAERWAEAPARGADRTVAWLATRGVRRVFGIPGGTIAPLYDALIDSETELVVCQHEGMAAYLACGEALETGRPGVVLVTSGPGVLNTVTAVASAFHDEIPLLVLAGEVKTAWHGRGVVQDGGPSGLDIRTIFRSVTRFQDDLTQPERLDEVLGRAWEATLQHPRGPALLRLPVDQIAAPIASVPTWRSSLDRTAPDLDRVDEAAAWLAHAQRPLIVAGIGARSARAGDALARLAYRLRAPILTEIEAKSLLPDSEPLHLGHLGHGATPAVQAYLAEGCDVMVAVGARFDDVATQSFDDALRPSRALIQLDHDAQRLGRAWPADVAIHGDLVELCGLLTEACGPLPVESLLRRDAAIREARAGLEEVLPHMTEAPFDPRAVVTTLRRAWPSATVFSDIGNHLLFAARYATSRRAGDFHVSLGLAGMGSGIGGAMGMAAARGPKGHPVVCICGDGGLLMVGSELATCARYEIPVVLAVFDDGYYGMVEAGMQRLYGRSAASQLPEVTIVDYAEALGVRAIDVRGPEDLCPPANHRGPLVLRIPINRSVRAPNPRVDGLEHVG